MTTETLKKRKDAPPNNNNDNMPKRLSFYLSFVAAGAVFILATLSHATPPPSSRSAMSYGSYGASLSDGADTSGAYSASPQSRSGAFVSGYGTGSSSSLGTSHISAMSHKNNELKETTPLRGSSMKKSSSTTTTTATIGNTYQDQINLSMDQLKQKENDIQSFMLVHKGNMHIRVRFDDMSSIMDKIDTIVTDIGKGYYELQRHDNSGSEDEHHQMTIRIQSDRYQRVVEEIKKVSYLVVSVSTNTVDVTNEYVDASARADVLEAARASLQAIMVRADTVADVIEVQNEMNRLMQSSESLRQRAHTLKNEADYSTLDLGISIVRQNGDTVSSWNPLQPVSCAIRDIAHFSKTTADVILYFSIWSIPIVLGIYVVRSISIILWRVIFKGERKGLIRVET